VTDRQRPGELTFSDAVEPEGRAIEALAGAIDASLPPEHNHLGLAGGDNVRATG